MYPSSKGYISDNLYYLNNNFLHRINQENESKQVNKFLLIISRIRPTKGYYEPSQTGHFRNRTNTSN